MTHKMKFAFNNNGTLQDVIETNPNIIFPEFYAAQFVEVPDDAQNGDLWDGETLTRPPVKPPEQPKIAEVTMRQARLALLDVGRLADVDEAINRLPEPERTKAKIEWDYASAVYRNSEWVVDVSEQLGLSETQLDDLFALAATK